MNPERWRQIDEVFQAALECPAVERIAFISQACGDDASLRREVEALLAADGQAGSLIETPAYAVVAPLIVEADAQSLVGKSIGYYQIISLLGKGGMGEVYRARDSRLSRNVALKILPQTFSQDAERLPRFEREARAVSALNHPNIITIHEIGEVRTETESTPYIVTEYVEGETLRQRMAAGKRSLNEVLEVVIQVAGALAAAHAAGIIHRDIKPENVMVRPDGLVKVLDFGLAKLAEPMATPIDAQAPTAPKLSTKSGMVMGTASYMSPEQARGQKMDHRTDIFSLGVMLYEMVAGKRPFEGETTSDVIAALLTTEPLLRQHCPEAPAELERIVSKCLAKQRDARYQSARELIAELKTLQTGNQRPTVAISRITDTANHTAPLTERHDAVPPVVKVAERADSRGGALASTLLPRRSRTKILGVCVLLLIVCSLGWRELSRFRNAADKTPREVQPIQINRFTASGNVVTATLSPDGKYVATALDEGGLQSLWVRQTTANGGSVRLIAPALVEYWGLTFSHDSNFIYYLSWVRNQSDAELYQLPVLGGTPRRLPIKQLDTPISFAPAGNRFAYVTPSARRRESYVMVAPVDDQIGEILVTRREPGFVAAYPGGPDWSPDGQFIAYAATGPTEAGSRPMHVFVVNVADKSERQLSKQRWVEMGRVVWLRDGSGLVVSAREDKAGPQQLWFVTWPDGAVRKLTNDLHDYDSVSLSADGETLVAVQTLESFSIAVAPQGKGTSLFQTKDIYSEVGSGGERLAWTHDQRLLYASRFSGNWDIWLMNKDGSDQRQLTVDPHNDKLPAVSADGRYVYFSSDRVGTANIWRMELDGSNATQLTNGSDQFFPEVTPNSQWLFYQQGLSPNEVNVWRMKLGQAGGEPVRVNELITTERVTRRPAVSPDGQWLAYVSLDEQGWGVMLRAIGSGEIVKRFTFPSNIAGRDVRWAPDGQALVYIVKEKSVNNLWLQPVSGAPPTQLTRFKTGRFSTFAWSPDGQWLAYLRTTATSDVVLLRDFK